MANASAVTMSAGGLALFGIATGLHPTALIAGFCGGLFALSCQPAPMSAARRVSFSFVSSVSASYLTPMAIAVLRAQDLVPVVITQEIIFPCAAFLIGFLSHNYVGPAVVRVAQKLTEDTKK